MGSSSKQVCNDDDDLSKSLLDLPNSPLTTKEEVEQLEGIINIDCPRCGSNNTKFCYYNNYNKSQPRHFCKGCKRHWTKGGTLRKVPLGGGRKNKRLKITPYSASNASSAPSVQKASSTTSLNILMNNHDDDQDCHEFHLGAHEGSKDMTDDEKNISHIQFETFIDYGNRQSFTFSGLDSFQFDGNIIPSNHTSGSSNTVFSPAWQSAGVVGSKPNCWNLNDLDALISADLNVPWPDDDDDDAYVHPRPSI